MITSVKYIRPNITIETIKISKGFLYVYNYQGVHYRIFGSRESLDDFIETGNKTWLFDTDVESEVEKFVVIGDRDI